MTSQRGFKDPTMTSQRGCKDSTMASQRGCKDVPMTSQRGCKVDITMASQRGCKDLIMASQRGCKDPTMTSQRGYEHPSVTSPMGYKDPSVTSQMGSSAEQAYHASQDEDGPLICESCRKKHHSSGYYEDRATLHELSQHLHKCEEGKQEVNSGGVIGDHRVSNNSEGCE
uniref:S-antigen protein n=1 Tax=Cacopsylla melanoneura TaxID=428564 RepID=A0A8D8ZGC9_9HEMI